jgi:hypothetical protein
MNAKDSNQTVLSRLVAFFGQNEGLAISGILIASMTVIMAIITFVFTIDSVQCSRMCDIAGDRGVETGKGCVCTTPEGERWTYPVAMESREQ